MSEHIKETGGEHLKSLEVEKRQPERMPHDQKAEAHHEHAEHLQAIQKSIEHLSVSAKEIAVGERESGKPNHTYITKELKKEAYKKVLGRTQKHLPPLQRTFSTFVHQPIVQSVTEVAAKTVGRPWGFVGGSLSAFMSSTFLLYYAKHYGFRYNFLLLAISFISGYLLATILEVLVSFLSRLMKR